jgi:hypothetical protein
VFRRKRQRVRMPRLAHATFSRSNVHRQRPRRPSYKRSTPRRKPMSDAFDRSMPPRGPEEGPRGGRDPLAIPAGRAGLAGLGPTGLPVPQGIPRMPRVPLASLRDATATGTLTPGGRPGRCRAGRDRTAEAVLRFREPSRRREAEGKPEPQGRERPREEAPGAQASAGRDGAWRRRIPGIRKARVGLGRPRASPREGRRADCRAWRNRPE